MSFSGRPSSICLSFSLKSFPIFDFFSRTTGPILTKLGTKHPLVKWIQSCSNEGPRPFPRGDNKEIVKIHWRNLNFFIRTTGPISTKLCTKHPWVMEIHVSWDECPRPFPMRDNNEIAKIFWRYFKFVFLGDTGPISTKHSTKHYRVMGIPVCANEGPWPFPWGDNKEIVKIHWPTLKIFSRTTGPIAEIFGMLVHHYDSNRDSPFWVPL